MARGLGPWVPEGPKPPGLRGGGRARRDLVAHRVAAANQLRAHLQIVFPAAATLFADTDSAITPTFLGRFTTQEAADWLSPKPLAPWRRSGSYSGGVPPAVLHARLLAAPRGPPPEPAGIHP